VNTEKEEKLRRGDESIKEKEKKFFQKSKATEKK